MAGSLRKTIEATGASSWSPMVLMARGMLGSPTSMVGTVETLYLGNGTDSPRCKTGLWLAPVKRSLRVQSQERVSWSSARGHGSHSLCFLTLQPNNFLQLSASLAVPQDW